MKIAWITLAIFAGLGVVCSGVGFFSAWGALKATQRANLSAEAWANGRFLQIGRKWRTGSLDDETAPKFKSTLEQRASSYQTEFGRLIAVEPFSATETKLLSTDSGPVYTVQLIAPATFEKRRGTVSIFVKQVLGGTLKPTIKSWQLQNLEVNGH